MGITNILPDALREETITQAFYPTNPHYFIILYL